VSVDVILSHPWKDPKGKWHEVGERLSLTDAEARHITTSGRGLPATKNDAKSAGVDPESAASVKK